jgi:hypothetical protein
MNLQTLKDGAKETVKNVLGLHPAAHDLTILPDDTFLISYPKAGNTWVRFLLGQAWTLRPLDFASIERVIPDTYRHTDRYLLRAPRPRILKSHSRYRPRFPKVIYIVRDPRDLAISYYHWRKKRGFFDKPGAPQMELQDYLRHFAEQPRELAFAAWDFHVNSWLEGAAALGAKFKLVTYEEIERSPEGVLRDLGRFVGWRLDSYSVRFAVNASQADRMRRAEAARRDHSEKNPFVRKARSGQWREVFDDELNQLYWERFGPLMERFGYARSRDGG